MAKKILYFIPSNKASFPIMFHSLSSYYLQESVYRPKGWSLYQFLFVLDGEGELFCGGKVYKLKPGCAFLTCSNIPHNYINNHDLKTAFITTRSTFMVDILNYYNNNGFLFVPSINISEYVSILKAIEDEYYSRKREHLISAMTYTLVARFFEDAYDTEPSPIEKISLYIERNYTQPITLQELANKYNYSVSKLCKDFKNEFGCTIFEQILNLRLSYAHNSLITNKNILIKDIAHESGFSDECYFCRAYKKKYGHSPSNNKS